MTIEVRKEIKDILRLRWVHMLFLYISSQVIPFIELSIIYIIYLMIDPTKSSALIDKVENTGFIELPQFFYVNDKLILFLACTGIAILTIQLLLTYFRNIYLIKLNVSLYMRDANRLIQN